MGFLSMIFDANIKQLTVSEVLLIKFSDSDVKLRSQSSACLFLYEIVKYMTKI